MSSQQTPIDELPLYRVTFIRDNFDLNDSEIINLLTKEPEIVDNYFMYYPKDS